MVCDHMVRNTVALVLQSSGTRRQKVKALVRMRRQMKRFLETLAIGARNLHAACEYGAIKRLLRAMDAIDESLGYVGDIIRRLLREDRGRALSFGAAAGAYPVNFGMGGK